MTLNQVTLPTLNVREAILFYETLGLHLIVRSIPHYARFHCRQGDATFSLHLVDQLPTGVGATIYFECNKLDEFVSELVNKGIAFDEMPCDKSWLWREARLTDPDNNRLILYNAGKNRLTPPWAIG